MLYGVGLWLSHLFLPSLRYRDTGLKMMFYVIKLKLDPQKWAYYVLQNTGPGLKDLI